MPAPADIQALIDLAAAESSPPILIEIARSTMRQKYGYSTTANSGDEYDNENPFDDYFDPYVRRVGLYLIANDLCSIVDPESWGGMANNLDVRGACPPRDTPVADARSDWNLLAELKHVDVILEERRAAQQPLTNGVS